ncbi:MAG: terpene cyclase/mutase family protein [Pirellulaceae bacterium]|nr:terpene cyclase/mutase family protein [Pirellulaceae bacterium]
MASLFLHLIFLTLLLVLSQAAGIGHGPPSLYISSANNDSILPADKIELNATDFSDLLEQSANNELLEHNELAEQFSQNESQEEANATAETTLTLPNQLLNAHKTDSLLVQPLASRKGGGLDSRKENERQKMITEGGGTAQSEQAVANALRWLAKHQLADGSWRLQFAEHEPCNGQCRHQGLSEHDTGATALALYAFLGSGQTHQEGQYKKAIENGLNYLLKQKRTATNTENSHKILSDFRGVGDMYSHGLATIVLCEIYTMTGDSKYKEPAQEAINYIVYTQNPNDGGWRYTPRQPGDMTVTGWQIMALRSGQMAGMSIPPETLKRAEQFLDKMETEKGAYYGYIKPDKLPGPTSIGLLNRMYFGIAREDPQLKKGVDYLVDLGPSPNDIYFNFYTTQILRHQGGPQWEAWNEKMREYLIRTQASRGHESGSWYFEGDQHNEAGGRLYCTAMSAMILEVYYRYAPLYQKSAVPEEPFILRDSK